MSSTQHQLIEQCAARLRGIVEALDNIHDTSPQRWSTDLDDVHSSAESLLALIKDQAPARSDTSFEEWLANELEGEDGQPVPAAVCDIALARRAFNHWPKLEQPAKVGGVRFSAGVSSRLVVEAAQRLYEFESTPEKEAERIERLQAFREQLDPLNLAPHAEAFNEAPAEALKSEQAEVERPEMSSERAAYFMRRFKSEEKLLGPNEQAAVDYVLSLIAQHERIVEAWIERWKAYIELSAKIAAQRDAAQARVAELELGIARIAGDFLPDNSGQAELALDEMRQALHELLAAAPTQAQHSVPEKVRTLLSRAQCEIEHLAECLENVCEDEEDFDVREDVADGRVVAADIAHMLAAAPGKEVPQAWLDVQAERLRQVEAEGWTPEHDDEHACDEIAAFACFYAMPPAARDWDASSTGYGDTLGEAILPEGWEPKTGDRRRDLVKACALALAEIERLDRAGISQNPQPGATRASS
ncbi:hypothetical protein IPC491_08760 [Pseudomonas aeruginosa]|uniref:hypothetical protein n=1 Tax=Pseudomonas aeruginosa TaxID=287 RepID=UPI000F52032D|nr:hypothetical protein [Pseudomonas aeruginosa]RQA44980.1 hypothetical protein IPC491_08760 [Pseudomonas aeruginosa]RUI76387.1 hypothetical protein IPC411_05475 [Pseudomonas aeruginosa]HBO4794442.1 hypothetical protein [Pseudomonas aeruginosa]HCG0890528.1 hypothetical protein [Pseudomonas aeruginosa]HEH6406446.1 hypothetical protein [Pseudomonas aeruginosa]